MNFGFDKISEMIPGNNCLKRRLKKSVRAELTEVAVIKLRIKYKNISYRNSVLEYSNVSTGYHFERNRQCQKL